MAANADPIALIDLADEIWTMTSLIGFEALIRGKRVICLGTPFYAGWGLTTDLGEVPNRRRARPELDALVHATLIDYPLYIDPVSRKHCSPECAVERLTEMKNAPVKVSTRSKVQRALAPMLPAWRKLRK